MFSTTNALVIKASTWSKESKDLFDYETRHTTQKIFETRDSTEVVYNQEGYYLKNDEAVQVELDQVNQPILNIRQDQGSYYISKADITNADCKANHENLWLVVKSVLPGKRHYKGHELIVGDICKLGKVKLRVRELRATCAQVDDDLSAPLGYLEKPKEYQPEHVEHPNFIQTCEISEVPTNQDLACRICLESDQDENNTLVSPCQCSGSVKHVHLQCLKKWIDTKCYSKVDEACHMYMWKDLECELCHQQLPDLFLNNGCEVQLVDLVRPTTPYIIFETMPENKDIRKAFFVVTVTNENKDKLLNIGRKGDCHIKVNDISVSRLHAMVKLSDGKFFLENGFSKFGTLVLLRDEIRIPTEYSLSVQIGRTHLAFELQEREVFIPQYQEIVSFPAVSYENTFIENMSLLKKEIEPVESNLLDTSSVSLPESYAVSDEKNYTARTRTHSFDTSIQSDLKHIDEVLARVKSILGERYSHVSDGSNDQRDNIIDQTYLS